MLDDSNEILVRKERNKMTHNNVFVVNNVAVKLAKVVSFTVFMLLKLVSMPRIS